MRLLQIYAGFNGKNDHFMHRAMTKLIWHWLQSSVYKIHKNLKILFVNKVKLIRVLKIIKQIIKMFLERSSIYV